MGHLAASDLYDAEGLRKAIGLGHKELTGLVRRGLPRKMRSRKFVYLGKDVIQFMLGDDANEDDQRTGENSHDSAMPS